MKNKKGFTLIELLAIIVILAIIAVITVPIILNVIEEAKRGTIIDSAYGYKDAINTFNATQMTVNPQEQALKGSYTVEELKTAGITVNGKEPTDGIILVDDEGVSGCLKYEEYATYINNGKVINTVKGDCPPVKFATTGAGLYKSKAEPGKLVYKGSSDDTKNIIAIKENNSYIAYRIVSFETDGTIKVVRNARLSSTGSGWDLKETRNSSTDTFCSSAATSGCNVWGNQNNTTYKGSAVTNFQYEYYTSNTAQELTKGSAGTVTTDSSLNTYLNSEWINSVGLSNYIQNHDFNVGGIYYFETYSNGDKGIVKEAEEERQYKWNGKVGILTATEFVESSLNPECTSVYSNFNFAKYPDGTRIGDVIDAWPCPIDNYNFKTYYQWTMTPYSYNRGSAWIIFLSNGFYGITVNDKAGIRPSFYLKAGTKLTGEGTSASPFRVEGM